MENFLNLCWLLLALTALAGWGCHTRGRRAGRSCRLLALICALALMFPVISATDDLHPAAQAIEDSSKRSPKAARSSNATQQRQSSASRFMARGPSIVPLTQIVELLQTVPAQHPGNGVSTVDAARSPPVLTV
jgi:hypothetical protein